MSAPWTRVLQAFTDAPRCRGKVRRPAGQAALAEAARPQDGHDVHGAAIGSSSAERVVIDLATYAALFPAAARATTTGSGTPAGWRGPVTTSEARRYQNLRAHLGY